MKVKKDFVMKNAVVKDWELHNKGKMTRIILRDNPTKTLGFIMCYLSASFRNGNNCSNIRWSWMAYPEKKLSYHKEKFFLADENIFKYDRMFEEVNGTLDFRKLIESKTAEEFTDIIYKSINDGKSMTIEKDGLLCEEFEKIDYVGIELQYGNDLVEYGLKLSIGYNVKKRKCYISRIREDVDDFWTDITAGNYTVFFEPRRNEIDRGSLFSRILDKLHYFLFWVISPKISELKEKFKIKK